MLQDSLHHDEDGPARSITDGLKTISYVQNGCGRVECSASDSWQPVNEVNQQAWQEIHQQVAIARQKVAAGHKSCLYYYMTVNQMSPLLLASYSNQPIWKVLLHLQPFFYARLGDAQIARYAALFHVTPEDLRAGNMLSAVYQTPSQHD